MTPPTDLDVLQRVIRESGVDQTVPAPTWSGYALAVLEAFADWLRRALPDLRGLRQLPTVIGPAVAVIAAALVLLVLLAVVRAAVSSRRRQAHRAGPATRLMPAPVPVPDRDPAGWRQEIERRLGAGDLAGALEALWWWFARTLTAGRVDPAWTSRELLAHTQRVELAPLALALDRLLYAAQRPQAEHIRGFLHHVDEVRP